MFNGEERQEKRTSSRFEKETVEIGETLYAVAREEFRKWLEDNELHFLSK